MFLLFLIIVSFGVFLSKPKEFLPALVFNKPKVNIDMSIFDTDQFKNLRPFPAMETQYSYNATTKDNKSVSGFVSAPSLNDAQNILTGQGLFVIQIKQTQVGRDNPFIPYYASSAAPAAGVKK
jgi:hypothetical protein